jgi:hypothetical protein
VSDRPSTYEAGGNIREKKNRYPVRFPQRRKILNSIIRFIGGGSVIVCVTVIIGVTGDQSGEVFLGGHEEGGD